MTYTDEYLTTVPMFTFWQDDEDSAERPIIVKFYNGTVSLEQINNTVIIDTNSVNELFKAIKKFLPEALKLLEK